MAGVNPANLRVVDSDVPFRTCGLDAPDSDWMQTIQGAFNPSDWRYMLIFSALNIFFCFFYTAVMFNPVDVAENLKKFGGISLAFVQAREQRNTLTMCLTRLTCRRSLYRAGVLSAHVCHAAISE